MNTGSSIPVQVGQKLSKGKLTGEQWTSLEAARFDEVTSIAEAGSIRSVYRRGSGSTGGWQCDGAGPAFDGASADGALSGATHS